MKILHVIEAPGQGTGRHVVDLAEGLRDRGHEVHIVFSNHRISPDFERELHQLRDITVQEITMRRSIHPSDAGAVRALRGYMRAQGPFDIVHGHSSKGGALARIAAVGTGATRLYTPHCLVTCDPSLSPARYVLYGAIERALSTVTQGLILCSPEEMAAARALRIPRDKLFIIPHGVRTPDYVPRDQARRRLGLSDGEICVGFIGRFVPQKAPERVLRAFALVYRGHPEVRLVMVGAGELAGALRAESAHLELGDRVIWTGEIPSREIFAAIDVLVLPSRYEGFSYTALEAAALAVPLVATDASGMSMIVDHGATGLIVPQQGDDPIEVRLASAVGDLIAARQRRAAMSVALRHKREVFNVDRMIEQTLLVYEALRRAPTQCSRRPLLADYVRLAWRRAVSAGEPDLVSVVTVTKNAAATLARAIDSVHRQTYPAVEHIIVDGGSRDTTAAVAQARLRPQDCWFSEPDLGISDAFNKGIALARGRYVQLMGADDWLTPAQIEIAVAALARSGADFVFGDGIAYNGDQPVFSYHGDPHYATRIERWMPVIIHPSLVARRALYEAHGLFRITLKSAMDYDWLLHVHRSGAVGVHDPALVSHIALGGTHLRFYRRTMREVRDIAVGFGRSPWPANAEYAYHVGKHAIAERIQLWSRPLYDELRARLNPAFKPIRAPKHVGGYHGGNDG